MLTIQQLWRGVMMASDRQLAASKRGDIDQRERFADLRCALFERYLILKGDNSIKPYWSRHIPLPDRTAP